ncbi:MAG: DUF2723 domain-containing protein [Gemmatimonadetes bacterium]|nr:DUF2723 domain-containing protein [Gemmatimonadota bacterium]
MNTPRRVRLTAEGAAAISGGALFAVYLATLAPSVTLWDSGEFLAAARTLGIPHPPGTPLFIFWSRAWAALFGWLPFALAVNLASAASAATGAALFAWLVSRWTGRPAAGLVGAVVGGTMATVWQSATEAEVYSHVLLGVGLALLVAEVAGTRWSWRHRTVLAFIFGLAVPLHLSVLVAGPAVILLAATDRAGLWSLRASLVPAGAWAVAVGIGTVSILPVALGGALFVVAGALSDTDPAGQGRPRALLAFALTLLGASFVLVMLVRAQHDPAINEGNPAHWQSLLDVIARRQYDVPPLWPRRAPAWLQFGNLIQYADWQVAVGVSSDPGPSPWRTSITLVYAALAVLGARWHRRRDRRSWNVLALLALCSSLGVVAVLNLRAGPSFGWGILPDDALREARERDYFFALAFLVVGLWIGCGITALTERWRGATGRAAWLLVALPLVLNWRGVDRRRGREATLANDVALALLQRLPAHAVLVLAGDNDSFPIWYAQQVEGVRTDVTPVTIPLLGAGWYRRELQRRHDLLPVESASSWGGVAATLRMIGRAGRSLGRPVVVAVSVAPADRRAVAPERGWTLEGMWYRPLDRDASSGALSIDSIAVSQAEQWWQRRSGATLGLNARDPAGRYVQRLLTCPTLARQRLVAPTPVAPGLLESICNFR